MMVSGEDYCCRRCSLEKMNNKEKKKSYKNILFSELRHFSANIVNVYYCTYAIDRNDLNLGWKWNAKIAGNRLQKYIKYCLLDKYRYTFK